jgi:broad specificity phosphatase PhoE
MASRLVLIRHGETEWSRTGRHTGRTDIGLTEQGETEARLVVPTLSAWTFSAVFSSPLARALETARIAGYEPAIDATLMEWDYGEIEGRRNDEVSAEIPGWSKWTDDVPGGEQVDDVGARSDAFLERCKALDGDVAVFAHGHFLSVTIARWLGLDARDGRRFPLATATVSVLGTKRSDRTLQTMNHRCGAHLDGVEVPG